VVQGSLNVRYLLSFSRLEHYASHLRDSGEPLVVPPEWEQTGDVGCQASKEAPSADIDVNEDGLLIRAENGGKGTGGGKLFDSHVTRGVQALFAEARGKAGGAAIRALVAAGVPVDGAQKQVNISHVFAYLRICGYADMRICGYADMRICGYADMHLKHACCQEHSHKCKRHSLALKDSMSPLHAPKRACCHSDTHVHTAVLTTPFDTEWQHISSACSSHGWKFGCNTGSLGVRGKADKHHPCTSNPCTSGECHVCAGEISSKVHMHAHVRMYTDICTHT
jgi:hypothetical protein